MRYTLEQKLERWEWLREIKNIMGRLSADYTLKQEDTAFERYWSRREDVSLGINSGYFTGPESVAGYYASLGEKIALESRLLQSAFPAELGEKTPEEIKGVGMMTYKPVDTFVVEIAEDGETAKGIWCVRGSHSELEACGPVGYWDWGWFAVDFVREGEEWKIWHMLWLYEIKRQCGAPWTGPEKKFPERPEYAEVKDFRFAEPDIPCALRPEYSADRPFTRSPRVPEPYRSFAETFSYSV